MPIGAVDPWGLEPGDLFDTPEEAAIDAIEYIWRTKSNWKEVEYSGWILKSNGRFTYNEPIEGIAGHGEGFTSKNEDCADAWFHTHNVPSWFLSLIGITGEDFSVPSDILISQRYGAIGYLGTPTMHIKKYVPEEGITDRVPRGWMHRVTQIY